MLNVKDKAGLILGKSNSKCKETKSFVPKEEMFGKILLDSILLRVFHTAQDIGYLS